MKSFPLVVTSLLVLGVASASAHASEEGTAKEKPSLMHRMLHPFEKTSAEEKKAEPAPTAEAGAKKPSMMDRVLHPFGRKDEGPKPEDRMVGNRKLAVQLSVDPQPLKLSEHRQMKVTLVVTNKTNKFVQLEFPTTQRIEVIVRDRSAKLVEQWSEDHSFTSDPGLVSINPGERLEYVAMVATRDLAAGETYMVEAFFPNYETLKVQRTVTPQ